MTEFAGGVIRLAVIFPRSKATGICFQPVAPYQKADLEVVLGGCMDVLEGDGPVWGGSSNR